MTLSRASNNLEKCGEKMYSGDSKRMYEKCWQSEKSGQSSDHQPNHADVHHRF